MARASTVSDARLDPAARFERRFLTALACAAVIHVSVGVVARFQSVHSAPRASERIDYLEVSLLKEAEEAPPEAAAVPEGAPEPEHERVATLAERPVTERVASRDEAVLVAPPAESAATDVVTEAPADSAAPGTSAPRAGLSLDAIGLGNTNPFFGMKGLAGTEPPAPPPVTAREAPDPIRAAEQRVKQYLVAGMMAHDRATGASRNGAVITALRDAAMLVPSPVNGQAEFVATVDATGLVTALRLTRVSSGGAEWRNVAARALAVLAKKRLRVPAGAMGLEVRLALSSRIQQVSGSTSGLPTMHQVPLMNADGTKLSRLEQSPESAKLPDPNDPGALGTPAMRQPIPGGGLDGDLADIGGHASRIVHVTITDERPL